MDINMFWTKSEFKRILEDYSHLQAYIYDDRHNLQLIDKLNWAELFDQYHRRNFSVTAHMAVVN